MQLLPCALRCAGGKEVSLRLPALAETIHAIVSSWLVWSSLVWCGGHAGRWWGLGWSKSTTLSEGFRGAIAWWLGGSSTVSE